MLLDSCCMDSSFVDSIIGMNRVSDLACFRQCQAEMVGGLCKHMRRAFQPNIMVKNNRLNAITLQQYSNIWAYRKYCPLVSALVINFLELVEQAMTSHCGGMDMQDPRKFCSMYHRRQKRDNPQALSHEHDGKRWKSLISPGSSS